MNLHEIDRKAKLERIEWTRLPGKRPRVAGRNARLPDVHGVDVSILMARLTIGGSQGFGWSGVSKEHAESLIGTPIGQMLDQNDRIKPEYRAMEIALLDWLAKQPGHPVSGLVDVKTLGGEPLKVECYDTSLYMDDLDVDDAAAIKLQQEHAQYGLDHGHRNFKMKIGRGARHMPTQKGLARDIAVVNAVRETIGPEGKLLVDTNNGYTLNLAKEFLSETKSSKLFFIEEPFHEDPPTSRALKDWMREQGMETLLADGEGNAAPQLVQWAMAGHFDVLQHDIFQPGFTWWLETAELIRPTGVKIAPHHYGAIFGNFVAPHLAPVSKDFLFAEWDEAEIDGLDRSGYRISGGKVEVPMQGGFGLGLDDAFFSSRVKEVGWSVS